MSLAPLLEGLKKDHLLLLLFDDAGDNSLPFALDYVELERFENVLLHLAAVILSQVGFVDLGPHRAASDLQPLGEVAVSTLGLGVVFGQGIQVLLLLRFVVLKQPTLEEGGEVAAVVGNGGELFVGADLGAFQVFAQPYVHHLLSLLAFACFSESLEVFLVLKALAAVFTNGKED